MEGFKDTDVGATNAGVRISFAEQSTMAQAGDQNSCLIQGVITNEGGGQELSQKTITEEPRCTEGPNNVTNNGQKGKLNN